MLHLNKHEQEHILTCIAYCGKVDRIAQNYGESLPNDITIKLNAGYDNAITPNDRDALVAKGTLEWLREFHDHPDSFSLSNTSIKAMHRKIFKYSPRDDGTRGRFRTDPDDDIKRLLDELKNDLSSGERHPLFMISLFRTSFIEAMPFVTGNTYCANLLSYVLLIQNGYGFISRLPLLASLNNANSQIPLSSIAFLPNVMFNEMLAFSSAPKTSADHMAYLNPRRKKLFEVIQAQAPLKISDIMISFPGESRNTIKKDLLYLRDKEMILAKGTGRGVYYTAVV